LISSFRNFKDIDVKLVAATPRPFEIAVASARTCYSKNGVVFPDAVLPDAKAAALRDKLAASTLAAGHLTTRQHATFVFSITGISRQCLWSFLHSHPHYNSEQVSQRYVKVTPGNYLLPPMNEKATRIYERAALEQIDAYEKLIALLTPVLTEDYFERFPSRKKEAARWEGIIRKRAYEVARYVLGIGTTGHLYHTISALTLFRYARLSHHFDTPTEQQALVAKMLDEVHKTDSLFEKDHVDPLPEEKTPEYAFFHEPQRGKISKEMADDFDKQLSGHISKLVSYPENLEEIVAQAARVSLGLAADRLNDTSALEHLLDPGKNPLLADTLNPSVHDRFSQCLRHAVFTFQKKLSHCADSQDQRHRTVLSSRPMLLGYFSETPDYIVPYGVTQCRKAESLYRESMANTFAAATALMNEGVKTEFAQYLLPNAVPIRMFSTGDMLSLHHKWKMRSCYNAQEEIFRATLDELTQIQSRFPRLSSHLRAPCYLRLRAGMTPYCPEGDHFCGLPVWKYALGDYQRKSL
jgi:flavin-dependent thymidylate synthase